MYLYIYFLYHILQFNIKSICAYNSISELNRNLFVKYFKYIINIQKNISHMELILGIFRIFPNCLKVKKALIGFNTLMVQIFLRICFFELTLSKQFSKKMKTSGNSRKFVHLMLV